MKFNLIVLRSSDMQKLADFYSNFGMAFTKHRHGKGPEHYGTEDCGIVFEIYSKRNESDRTLDVRFGFEVDDIDGILKKIEPYDYKVISEPKDSPWGRRMVLDDIEGHRIELTQKQ